MPLATTARVLLDVNYGHTFTEAISGNGFTPFRMGPLKQSCIDFSPRSNEIRQIEAHFYRVPEGYELKDVPRLMQESVGVEKKLRPPSDIREVLALGPIVLSSRHQRKLAIIAPTLVDPGLENLILKLLRYPEWMGLMPNTWDPDRNMFSSFEFVAFSDDCS